MGLTASANVHRVTRIETQRIDHGDFVSHEFAFLTEDGTVVEVNAFAAEHLELVELGDSKSRALQRAEVTR